MRTPAETARCFGGGLKGHALSMHFQRNIKPNSKLIIDALARGEDPLETVVLSGDGKIQGGKGQMLCIFQLHIFIILFRSDIY